MKRQNEGRTVSLLLAGALLVGTAQWAFGWGAEGHQAIAEFAQGQLNPKARAAVVHILGDGQSLAQVSTWADEVRAASRHQGPLVDDPEVQQFNQDFPHNADWHFVNLPLGTAEYRDNGPFSGPNDVVHAINRCIKVLESPADTPNFSRPQALKMLVHLVGDVHQPLHVATGYYKIDGGPPTLITDPTDALHKPDDRGGNQLCFHPPAHGTRCFPEEVHNFWDANLVADAGKSGNAHQLADVLKTRAADPQWAAAHKDALDDPPGDYHQWAEQWAGASVKQAHAAYQGITFGKAVVNHGKIQEIAVTLPGSYETDQTDRATAQLVAGGIHLAHLMNQIKWK